MVRPIVILGVFVADAAFRADRAPAQGETVKDRKFVRIRAANDARLRPVPTR
jgi:hypothetical protein